MVVLAVSASAKNCELPSIFIPPPSTICVVSIFILPVEIKIPLPSPSRPRPILIAWLSQKPVKASLSLELALSIKLLSFKVTFGIPSSPTPAPLFPEI